MKKTTTLFSSYFKKGFLTLLVCILTSHAWAQPSCHAHFIHYPSSSNPDSIHFYVDTANTTSAQYYWNFGDGTSSNLLNPWHLYLNAGTYYVCLYVKDSSSAGTCIGHWCDSVKVVNNPPPPVCHAHFVHYPSTSNPDSVHFNTDTANATGTKYTWIFGDGTYSTTLTPWHQYPGPGTYYACLEVSDSTSSGTCTARWCDSIKVTGNPPPPHNCSAHFIHYFLTSNPDSVHFYPDSTSKNSANTIYYWNFGDGKTATFLNPWHVYAPGNYWACLTVRDSTSSGLCYSTFCDSVHVGNPLPPPPVCNAHFSHYSAANPDSVHFYPPTNPSNSHYLWTFGDGTTSDLQSPWHFYGGPGTYTVCLTVTDTTSSGICKDHWCDTIKVGNPPPPPPPVCNAHFQHYSLTSNADSVHFYGYNPTGTHYLWTFGDGTISDNPMPWHYYLNSGTYYVCLTVWDTTSAGTCKDSWCDSIKVGNPPPPPPPHNCSAHFIHYFITSHPDSIHFYPDSSSKNSSGTTYYWTFGDGKTSTLFNPWHVFAPGNYYACLTVRDSTSSGICYSHFCDSIHAGNPQPPPPLPTCNSHFVHYSSSTNVDSIHFYHAANDSTTRYYWSFGDGKYSTDVYPWHLYAPGTYFACLTVSDSTAAGKCKETWCDTVKVGTTPPPPPPVCNAHFSHYSLNTNADSVHFYSSNPTGTHYSWTFGDGKTSDNPSPWHYYLNAGTYTVCLTVWDTTSSGTCTDHWCDTVKVSTTLPPPPVCNAHFQHYSSTGNPDSVHFYGYNPTGTHYSWTFGDGTTSDNPSPWHFYSGPGVYYVCLTVWDTTASGTCTDHFCDSVKIGNPPPPPPPVCNAHFSHYSIASNPDSVHFYPNATTPAGYHFHWTFGDGTTSNDQFPWHYYLNSGTYYVCLVVEDSTSAGTCRDYWCDSVHVGNPPPPPPPVCNAHFQHYSTTSNIDSVHFYSSNPTGTHYSWTFGDGKTSDNPTPWHFYSGPGTYTVCLTVWDTTSSGTCTDYWCDTIKIGTNPPPPPPVCNAKFTHYSISNPDSVHFYILNTPPAGSHYLWTFGDGTSSTNQDPWHFYAPGTYYACLTITDSTSAGTCKDTWCDTVHVGKTSPPVCNAQFNHYTGNSSDSIHFYPVSTGSEHYSWTFGDGSTSTNKDPWHHYLNAGSYYVCLTVWDTTLAGSCKNTWCDSIHIKAPNPPICNAHYSFYPNTNNPDSIHFYSSNPTGTHYLWTFGDGTTSDSPYPWHFYSGPGVYYVCLTVWDTTSAGTCTDSHCDSVHVIKPVPPAPPVCNPEFTDSVSGTNPDSIHFTPKPNPPGTHYLWTFGDGKYSTNMDPWHLFATPGIYKVCLTVTDTNSAGSCGDTWCDSIHVAVPRPPHYVSIYPNPTSQRATVTLLNMESTVSFNIFDPIGHLVYRKENLTDGNFDLQTATLIPGIYFYRVDNGSEILSIGKLLIVAE